MKEFANGNHGAAAARQAETVKQAAAELRRAGEKGELHFRIDSTGRPVRLSAEQVAFDREVSDLRLRRAQVESEAKLHDSLSELRRRKAALDRRYA